MILYRKTPQLRLRREAAPEAPFWALTTIAPYGPKRSAPVAIDYLTRRASGAEKLEVAICDRVRDELERARTLHGPVLIDAAEQAEVVFRRGEEARAWCEEQELATSVLVTTPGALPPRGDLIVGTWPPDSSLFAEASGRRWGAAVPVIFPITTELALLEQLADEAQKHGASFFAAISVEVEPTAKQAIAQSRELAADDDLYATLFHSDVAPVQLATERHIAALAHERGMADFILPPHWEERSNWNASVLLTLTATRMIAMELDLDLAGTLARSARTIAELDKPLTRIAESASLSIVGGVDDTSVEILTTWIAGEPAPFVDWVNEQWRLRRG
ncbi:MAG: hypothetical protein ABI779_20760 [Acidobacteriota bacterium]